MIKHIVMWKMDSSYSNTEKNEIVKTFGEQLIGLEGRIPELLSISVHFNSEEANDSNYDLLLDTSFNSIDDLNKYSVHPEHMKVVEFAKSFKKDRACVDFEIE